MSGTDARGAGASGAGAPAPPRRVAPDSVPAQFLWYLLVGGLSFVVDLAAFVALLGRGVPVMAALAAGFAVGTAANHLLSRALAFAGGRRRLSGEIAALVAVALTGLGLTMALVWAFMTLAGLSAPAAKIAATAIALVWNYLGRRWFVFRAEMPEHSRAISERLL